MLKPKTSVFGVLGMKTPQQVAAEEFQRRFRAPTPRNPYQAFGQGLGQFIGEMFRDESPEVARARKREEIGQGVLSQYYDEQQADEAMAADPSIAGMDGPEGTSMSPDRRAQMLALRDAEMYSTMADKYIAEGMLPEAEAARQKVQTSMTRAMDIQNAILGAEQKQQQMKASRQQVVASEQQVKASKQQVASSIAEEARKATTEEQKQIARTKLINVAGNEQALKDIGFPDALATRIANSENKEAYLPAILKRMETTASDDGTAGDSISTDQEIQQEYIRLVKERRKALAEGDTNKAEMLGIQMNSFAGILGLNSAKFEGVLVESLKKAEAANVLDNSASDLMARVDANKAKMLSGVPAQTDEAFKAVFGAEDATTVLRREIAKIRNSSVLQYLPPGVASDRDVALVLEGTLPNTADPNAILKFLDAIRKIASAERDYHAGLLRYLEDPEKLGNPVGYFNEYADKQRDARVQRLVGAGYTEIEAAQYGANPLDFYKALEAKKEGGDRILNLRERLGNIR